MAFNFVTLMNNALNRCALVETAPAISGTDLTLSRCMMCRHGKDNVFEFASAEVTISLFFKVITRSICSIFLVVVQLPVSSDQMAHCYWT